MNTIQPIETKWHGYRFRSRLEARWAVWLYSLGVRFEYEREGFQMGSYCFLPDFFLSDYSCYLEVKPNSDFDRNRLNEFVAHQDLVVVVGNPWPFQYILWLGIQSHCLWPAPTAQFSSCDVCQKLSLVVMERGAHATRFLAQYLVGEDSCPRHSPFWYCEDPKIAPGHSLLGDAYLAARSARFEHGDYPRVRTRSA
jgi:hypothetical protein